MLIQYKSIRVTSQYKQITDYKIKIENYINKHEYLPFEELNHYNQNIQKSIQLVIEIYNNYKFSLINSFI